MKNTFRKASLVLIGIIASLLLLEIVLQGAAWILGEHSHRAKTNWITGNLRVLALGDSNTYGLYLPAEHSYPAQLEKQWNRKHPELPIEMINLGYPGTNSFRLLANLPAILDTFQPDVVLLMIGFNDFWTPVETPATVDLTPLQKIKRYSRLYKLFFMLREEFHPDTTIDSGERQLSGFAGMQLSSDEISYIETQSGLTLAQLSQVKQTAEKNPALEQKIHAAVAHVLEERKKNPAPKDILNTVKYGDQIFSLGIIEGSSAGNSKHMENNIKAMLTLFEKNHVRSVLLDYPTQHGYYPAANRKIHHVATQTSTAFITLNTVFPETCRSKPDNCPNWLFYDAHATAAGNEQVAKTIMAGLESYLLGNNFPDTDLPDNNK